MIAVMATFGAFPAVLSWSYLTLRSGLKRQATRAGMYDPLYILCADPPDNGGKSLAVIGNLQRLAVRQAVQIDMVFRDVCADGNVSHLF